MMHKLNDELLEKVTGGVGFDYEKIKGENEQIMDFWKFLKSMKV